MCLSYARILGPKRHLDHKSFFSLDRHVNEFIQIISLFERSSFYLRCETVIGILYCAVVIKHVPFFTILAKLTVVFTCTSLPLNLYTSIFECGCGFGFEQKFFRINEFGEKKAQIGGFTYPYSPPSYGLSHQESRSKHEKERYQATEAGCAKQCAQNCYEQANFKLLSLSAQLKVELL